MKDRILKLLKLTESQNDNEALIAIRAANGLLKREGKTWEQLLTAPAGPQRVRIRSQRKQYSGSQIKNTLNGLMNRPQHHNPKRLMRIMDLKKAYELRGFLLEDEYEELCKIKEES